MTAGLEIINDGGSIQITDAYRNLHLKEKISVNTYWTSQTGYPVGKTYIYTISRTISDTAVIGVRSNTAYISAPILRSNSIKLIAYSPSGTSLIACDVFIFDRITSPPADNGGFEVYDASGNISFSAGVAPMLIKGSATATGGYVSGVGFTPATGILYGTPIATDIAVFNAFSGGWVSDGFNEGYLAYGVRSLATGFDVYGFSLNSTGTPVPLDAGGGEEDPSFSNVKRITRISAVNGLYL